MAFTLHKGTKEGNRDGPINPSKHPRQELPLLGDFELLSVVVVVVVVVVF